MNAFAQDGTLEFDRLLQFLDTLPIPMVVGQTTGPPENGVRPWRTIFLNERFRQVIGYSVDEVSDRDRWNEKVYPDPVYRSERMSEVASQASAARAEPGNEFVASVVRLRCKDGQDRWFEISKNYGTIHSGSYFVTTLTDVTALQNAQLQIERLARTDELTGLPNRRAMQDELAAAHARMLRNGHGFTCVMADIDHFKSVNDSFGHDCGDYVLVQVAGALEATRRTTDVISRWGGEEFCLLLGDTDTRQALALIDRLRDQLAAQPLQWNGTRLTVTMTFGVTAQKAAESIEEALSRADTAMYAGKRAGRDRVVVAD